MVVKASAATFVEPSKQWSKWPHLYICTLIGPENDMPLCSLPQLASCHGMPDLWKFELHTLPLCPAHRKIT